MTYLLDTNFVVGLLRGAGPYWDKIEGLLEKSVPVLSVVTRAEIFAGCHPHEEPATRRLLDRFDTVGIEVETADLAGGLVCRFRRKGLTLHMEDALIGATALSRGFALVTRNVRHFPMLTPGRNLVPFPKPAGEPG